MKETVNARDYAHFQKVLNSDDPDARLAELKASAGKIFLLDKDGKIIRVRRGKFLVPEFNKLYVILNLKRVFSFVAALVEYVFNDLLTPESYDANVAALAAGDDPDKDVEEVVPEVARPFVEAATKSDLEAEAVADAGLKLEKPIAPTTAKKRQR